MDYGLASGEVESSLAGSGTGAAAQTVDNKKENKYPLITLQSSSSALGLD